MSTLYKRKKSPYWVYASSFRGKRLRISTGMRQKIHAQKVQCEWDMNLFKGDISFTKGTIQMQNDIDAFMDEYLRLRARISENTKNTAHAVTKRFKSYLKTIGVISISDITTKVLDGYIDFLDCAPKTKHNHMMELKVMLGKAM